MAARVEILRAEEAAVQGAVELVVHSRLRAAWVVQPADARGEAGIQNRVEAVLVLVEWKAICSQDCREIDLPEGDLR